MACLGSVLIPLLKANTAFNAVLPRYQSWLVQAADSSTANVAELTAEARGIFLETTRAYYYDSIMFAGEAELRQSA